MVEVILGLPGPWADDYLEAADHYTTKIGGLPDWPFPNSSLKHDLLKCSKCRSDLGLISQVYAPTKSGVLTIEERVIFVFVCTDAQCGSWRAIRVQKPDKYEESKPASSEVAPSVISSVSTSNSNWWSDDEDSGDDEDISLEELSRAFSEAASLASGSAKQTCKKHTKTDGKSISVKSKAREADSSVFVLPCFYIYSQTDRSSKDLAAVCSSYSSPSKENQHQKFDDDEGQEVWENEEYEYDKALNADRTYLKFKKRIDACPEQCLRYSYGGKPLLAAGNATNPGTCSLCGEPRHYEMQLMPPLVYFLQEAAAAQQKDLLDNWSWLTLLVYTCSKSCFEKGEQGGHDWTVVEEAVILQSE